MNSRTIISPEDQKVTFVELFFDLVFVFSVTQVVGLFHHGVSWLVVAQVILVFWLVWWAWTQFTWVLNAADTTHYGIRLATLVATGVAFFMAVTLPRAFGEQSLWFAATYVLVRIIGLTVIALVSSQNQAQRVPVRIFTVISIGGLTAVLAGSLIGGPLLYWLWGLAIVLDVVAATAGTTVEGLKVHPQHFAERHGLFVIIALGETLIVAAGGLSDVSWTGGLIGIGILAVAITCSLWWSYFSHTKPEIDRAFESSTVARQLMMSREVFSLGHFPMLCGIIAYTVAIEEAIAHPSLPLPLAGRVALAIGLVLFVGGMATAVWRATNRLLTARVVITIGTAIAIVAISGVTPLITLLVALIGVLVIITIEDLRWFSRPVDAQSKGQITGGGYRH